MRIKMLELNDNIGTLYLYEVSEANVLRSKGRGSELVETKKSHPIMLHFFPDKTRRHKAWFRYDYMAFVPNDNIISNYERHPISDDLL